jgi:predicted unusual protein kinase regulating ubiquinone biosynthesis (AarF/ABC1/UbiB family)
VREIRRAILNELDLRQEVSNLQRIRKSLSHFERVVIPEPFVEFCGQRVICMEQIRGRKLTSVDPDVVKQAGGP